MLVVLSEFGRRGASLNLSLPRRQLRLWLHTDLFLAHKVDITLQAEKERSLQ